MPSWTPKAFYYDFGRPFPRNQVISLIKKFFSNTLTATTTPPQINIFEPCAGTGRITIPIASEFPNVSLTVFDHSEDMLEVLKYRIVCESLRNIEVHISDAAKFIPDKKFEMIIVCSALHAIKEWETVLDSWKKYLTPGGYICLIGEEADLYNQALGRKSSLLRNDDVDKNLILFWEKYREVRAQSMASSTESSQVGSVWEINNEILVDRLLSLDFKEVGNKKVSWIHSFKVIDFLKIIQERCYSSMFTIENDKYQEILNKMVRFSSQFDPNISISSRHVAIARFLQCPLP